MCLGPFLTIKRCRITMNHLFFIDINKQILNFTLCTIDTMHTRKHKGQELWIGRCPDKKLKPIYFLFFMPEGSSHSRELHLPHVYRDESIMNIDRKFEF